MIELTKLEEDLGVWVPNTVVSCFVLLCPLDMLQLFLGRDYNNKRFPKRKEFFESCSNQWGWVLVKDPKSSFVEEGMLVLITVCLRITWFLVLQSALPKP